MVRRTLACSCLGAALLAGCTPLTGGSSNLTSDSPSATSSTTLVPESRLGSPVPTPPPITQAAYAPASGEAATRVESIGQKLVFSNQQQIGMRPVFLTAGLPTPEIFHRGSSQVIITEGLVKQCPTQGQLAAVLCAELGKMVSEREAVAGPQARNLDRGPPEDVAIGNQNPAYGAGGDISHQAELAFYDKQHRRPALLPPDPQVLARSYLVKAGYPATELDGVAALLQNASHNTTAAKQLATPERPWLH